MRGKSEREEEILREIDQRLTQKIARDDMREAQRDDQRETRETSKQQGGQMKRVDCCRRKQHTGMAGVTQEICRCEVSE